MSVVESPSLRMQGLYVANRPDARVSFGLLTIRTLVWGAIPDGTGIRVSAGGASVELPISDCLLPLDEDAWQLTFHLNSHLLADGRQWLTATVTLPGGVEACSQALELRVANDSELARRVAADLRAFGTPMIFGDAVDSRMFPHGLGTTEHGFDLRLPEDPPMSLTPAPDNETALRHLHRWGFAVLPQRLPRRLVEAFARELCNAIDSGRLNYQRGSSDRIYEAHRLPAGRKVWLFPPVLEFLEQLFGDVACPCQTLTYVHGSQQAAHQDTIHLTPYPRGRMCGVWVALQDVAPDSGELFVCPGSHRLERVFGADLGLAKVMGRVNYSAFSVFEQKIADMIRDHALEAVQYRPRAGEILVWHENLVHGGSRRIDPEKTRLSIVSHYFARGSVAYYDSRGEAATLMAPGEETRWGRAKRLLGIR